MFSDWTDVVAAILLATVMVAFWWLLTVLVGAFL